MSNPTSNFGWQMPTPTDLVTDLPADFEVFGQAVDTDFVDLLGGTTGQILSKTSATDLDFTWVSPNAGDITGVTAGTGISGGGTSGTVTVTNSMATEITAKADLIVGTGNAAFDNLPVGTNGDVLTADSTVSPTGLKWAAPASGSFAGARLTKSIGQTISNNTDTMVSWDVETFDVGGYHDNSTNNTRVTIPSGKAGYYQINATLDYAANGTGQRVITLAKNGTNRAYNLNIIRAVNAGGYTSVFYSDIVYGAVADYFEISTFQDSGGNVNIIGNNGDPGACYFSISLIGA